MHYVLSTCVVARKLSGIGVEGPTMGGGWPRTCPFLRLGKLVVALRGLGIVQDHRTVTVWAVRRERDGDLLIHPAGNRSGGPLPVCRARLASRRLRLTFGFPLWKTVRRFAYSRAGLL